MVHLVIGTRAQLVKMGPVMAALARRGMPYRLILTAEHRETMGSMLEMYGVRQPEIVLGDLGRDITSARQLVPWFAGILAHTALRSDRVFAGDRTGIVVVHGDAPPALLGALMGKLRGLKVAHIEAGLRSFNVLDPFPEEIVRILTAGLADIFFAPGQWALRNLRWRRRARKVDTGANTLYDALRLAIASPAEPDRPDGPYCVFSVHRFENLYVGRRYKFIMDALGVLADRLPVVFVLHPVTRRKLAAEGDLRQLEEQPNVLLRPRYDYFDFIKLLTAGEFLATDGGSNQEECAYLGMPCLLLRARTERREGLGANVLLSNLELGRVRAFAEGYARLRREPIRLERSPSETIVDVLAEYSP